MAMTFQCDIVSTEESLFSGQVQMIVASAVQGDIGILYGHAPLLTTLTPGPVRVIAPNGDESLYYLSGGYLEVQPSVVSILADTAVRADDIDEAAALEAKKEALATLHNKSGEFDYSQAASQLAAAAAQLRTIEELRRKARKSGR